MKQPKKIYLMAVAATGKSRFAGLNESYRGYKVVDFAETLPGPSPVVKILLYLGRRFAWFARLARNSEFTQAKMSNNYHRSIMKFLRDQKHPAVVLGRPGPPNISEFSDIAFGAVLLPWPKHRRNCESRREQLRNPIRAFDHRSTHENEVKRLRGVLHDYARAEDVPIFESFEEALDSLIIKSRSAVSSHQRKSVGQMNQQLCAESTDS